MIALEAGSYGVPLIGAAVPGISSLIEQNKSGWLFAAQDSTHLAEILADEMVLKNAPLYGAMWKEKVLQFYTAETMASSINKLYHSLA